MNMHWHTASACFVLLSCPHLLLLFAAISLLLLPLSLEQPHSRFARSFHHLFCRFSFCRHSSPYLSPSPCRHILCHPCSTTGMPSVLCLCSADLRGQTSVFGRYSCIPAMAARATQASSSRFSFPWFSRMSAETIIIIGSILWFWIYHSLGAACHVCVNHTPS